MTLEDLARDPALVAGLTPVQREMLLRHLVGLLAVLTVMSPAEPTPSENGTDELLTVEQAAALLGVDRTFIWRRSRRAESARPCRHPPACRSRTARQLPRGAPGRCRTSRTHVHPWRAAFCGAARAHAYPH